MVVLGFEVENTTEGVWESIEEQERKLRKTLAEEEYGTSGSIRCNRSV